VSRVPPWAEHLRTSLRLRLGRRFVQLRRAVGRPTQRQPVRRTRAADAPIVVAGCHRSGTSLVRRILNSHSRIACPAEVQLFESLAPVLEAPFAERGFSAIDLTMDQVAADLGGLIDGWMSAHAERAGKPRWAEKSPGNVQVLPTIDRLLGHRATFLLIARDGMDVACSLGKGRWEVLGAQLAAGGDPYVAAARFWVERNRSVLAFREALPQRTHLLRYEDLVIDPERALAGVFAFLGEPWEPQVLDFNRFHHGAGLEDHVVSATWRVEDGRGKHRQLPIEQQHRMWEVVRPTMLDLGYEDRTYPHP
jgi:hypothetical protein